MENPKNPDTAYYSDWLYLPKPKFHVPAIKAAFTFETYRKGRVSNRVEAYKEDDDYIIVPREFYSEEKLRSIGVRLERQVPDSYEHVGFEDRITLLNDVQRDAYRAMVKAGNGVLQLFCGGGKSIIALKYVAYLAVPTIVVVPTADIMEQWRGFAKEFLGVEVGIIRGEDKSKWVWKKPLVLSMIQPLSKLSETLSMDFRKWFGLALFDEAHHNIDYFARTAPLFFGRRGGLSIGGSSRISVLIGGSPHIMEISALALSLKVGLNQVKEVNNIRVRAFNGKNFTWSPLEAIHRYKCHKKVFEVKTEFGRRISFTEDHSVYRVKKGDYYRKHNRRRYYGKLELVKGSDLKIGDYLLLENSIEFPTKKLHYIDFTPIDIPKISVAGDFTDWINTHIKHPKAKYRYKHGRHGPYLPIGIVRRSRLWKNASYIYTEAAQGNKIKPKVPVGKLAYFIGYFIGDGVISKTNSLIFYVPKAGIAAFIKEWQKLKPWVSGQMSFVDRGVGSLDVIITCRPLVWFFQQLFGGQVAKNKRLPDLVKFFFSRKTKLEVLRGLIDSDGHIEYQSRRRNRVHYVTVSKFLAEDLLEFLKSLGITASLSERPPGLGGKIGNRQIIGGKSFVIHWSLWTQHGRNTSRFGERFPFDMSELSGKPAKIKSISPVKEMEVYDLTVEGVETFVANSFLVHNSASVSREDGMHPIFLGHIGSVFYKNLEQPLTPTVYFISVPVEYSWATALTHCVDKNGEFNLTKMWGLLGEDDKFISACIQLIMRLVREGRKILFLSHRIVTLTHLYERLLPLIPEKVGLITGGEDISIRKDVLKTKRVSLGSMNLAKEGLDSKNLDTLIMEPCKAHGKKGEKESTTFQQATGRILRNYPKQAPKVYVLLPPYAPCYALCNTLKSWCSQRKTPFEIIKE